MNSVEILEIASNHLKNKLGRDPDKEEIRSFTGLTANELLVFNMRFDSNMKWKMTLKAIAEEIGLTRERVRQIENKTILKLIRFHHMFSFGKEYFDNVRNKQ